MSAISAQVPSGRGSNAGASGPQPGQAASVSSSASVTGPPVASRNTVRAASAFRARVMLPVLAIRRSSPRCAGTGCGARRCASDEYGQPVRSDACSIRGQYRETRASCAPSAASAVSARWVATSRSASRSARSSTYRSHPPSWQDTVQRHAEHISGPGRGSLGVAVVAGTGLAGLGGRGIAATTLAGLPHRATYRSRCWRRRTRRARWRAAGLGGGVSGRSRDGLQHSGLGSDLADRRLGLEGVPDLVLDADVLAGQCRVEAGGDHQLASPREHTHAAAQP